MPGKVYLIPTILSENSFAPITEQVRDVIGEVDVFFAENIRTARRYISALKTGRNIEELEFELLDKNTSPELIDRYIDRVAGGLTAGILSESGCPGIADPGARLVSRAHSRGIRVMPVSGPSSIFIALMGSGLSGQQFTFHGYLPIDRKQREIALRQLDKTIHADGSTQLFIETPYRNNQLFDSILAACRNDTLLCVACDVTGINEHIETRPVGAWQGKRPDIHKRPTVFLLGL